MTTSTVRPWVLAVRSAATGDVVVNQLTFQPSATF